MSDELEKSETSILTSIKKMLGLMEENEEFDLDIIMNINGAISTLIQLGIEPHSGFIVTSKSDTYEDWLGEMTSSLQSIKLYLFYKTKISFDPPTQPSILESYKELIKETEYRLLYTAELNSDN